MLRHHRVFKPSNRKAVSQHRVTQPGRFLPCKGVINLAGAVTEELMLPSDRISLEMIFGVIKHLRKKKPDQTDLDPQTVKL